MECSLPEEITNNEVRKTILESLEEKYAKYCVPYNRKGTVVEAILLKEVYNCLICVVGSIPNNKLNWYYEGVRPLFLDSRYTERKHQGLLKYAQEIAEEFYDRHVDLAE